MRKAGIQSAKKLQNDHAEALYWQALRLHEQVLGSEAPGIAESINQLVFHYGTQWRRTDAEPLIAGSIALLRQNPGPKYRNILRTLDTLASHACRLAHYEDAKAYYKQVLEAREELLGPNHPRTVQTHEKHAALLRQSEDIAVGR